MRNPIDLRNDAMDCLRLAEQASTSHKTLFLLMAQAWAMLARQAEDIAGLPQRANPEAAAAPGQTAH